MKTKLKTTLALFAAFCGLQLFTATTAWAAGTPIVVWDHDFGTTEKTGTDGNTYTFDLNGNTLNSDGTIKITGSKGAKIDITATTKRTTGTVIIKYRNLSKVSGGKAYLLSAYLGDKSFDDGISTTDANTLSIKGAFSTSTTLYGNAYTLSEGTGYAQIAFSSGSGLYTGTIPPATLIGSGTGGIQSGLSFSTSFTGITLGGIRGTAQSGWVTTWPNVEIEAVAVFDGYKAVTHNDVKNYMFPSDPLYGYHYNGNGNAYTPSSFTSSSSGNFVDGFLDQAMWINGNAGYGSGLSIGDNDFTVVFVAKSANTSNKIFFGLGAKSKSGFGFVSNGSSGLKFGNWSSNSLVFDQALNVASGQDATADYHTYVVKYVKSETKAYYSVDGSDYTEISTAMTWGNDGNWQIGSIHGGTVGSYAAGNAGAMDELRIYQKCLSIDDVKAIVKEFSPSETYTATIPAGNIAFGDITWDGGKTWSSGDKVHAEITLQGDTTLTLDANYTGRKLAIKSAAGQKLTLNTTGNGFKFLDLSGAAGKVVLADGLELAKNAVAGAPYSYWIGSTVTGEANLETPVVPSGYTISLNTVSGIGSRFVVTAPATAKFGSISVNLHNGATLSTGSTLSGAYPVAHDNWGNLQASANKSTTVGGVTFTMSSNASGYNIDTYSDEIYYQYMDDSSATRTISLSGISYAKYRIIVYFSTDTANSNFRPVIVNDGTSDVAYSGPSTGTTAGYTVKGRNDTWGHTGPDKNMNAMAEGVNYLVTDVMTTTSPVLKFTRNGGTGPRATPCAIQIVEVGVGVVPQRATFSMSVWDTTSDKQLISANKYAGYLPVAGAFWDQIEGTDHNGHPFSRDVNLTMYKSDGTTTANAANVTVSGNNTYRTGGTKTTGNGELTYNFIDDAQYQSTGRAGGFSFSNIPFTKYTVYVYMGSDSSNTSELLGPVNVKIGDTTTKYPSGGESGWGGRGYTREINGVLTFDATKNMVVIENMTASAFELTGSLNGTPANTRGGIAGIQIVDTSDPVAQIGINLYGSLNEAVAAVTSGGTIKLLAACNQALTTDKTFTLDLNGFAYTGVLTANEGAVVTLAGDEDGSAMTGTLAGAGEVIITDGLTVTANNDTTGYAITGTTVTINNGTLKLNNGGTGGDAKVNGATFNLGANGNLDNYGWMTFDGTVTINSDVDKTVLNNNNPSIRGGGTIVKTGTGTITIGALLQASDDTSHTHPVTVSAGALSLSTRATFPIGALSGSGTLIYDCGTSKEFNPTAASDLTAWTGTVWLKNMLWKNFDFGALGNANSKVKLTGITGYATNSAKACNTELVLEDAGNTKALTMSDGYSGGSYTYTIAKLSGSGTWARNTAAAQNYNISDVSAFTGAFALADGGPVINIGTSTRATSKDQGGIITIDSGYAATVASGKTWSAKNGINVNGTIGGAGTLASNTTFGDGAEIDARTAQLTASGTLTFGTDVKVRVATAPTVETPIKVISKTGSGDVADVKVYVGENETAESGTFKLFYGADGIYVTPYTTHEITMSADTTWADLISGKTFAAHDNIVVTANGHKLTFTEKVTATYSLVINGNVTIAAWDALYVDGCWEETIATFGQVSIPGTITSELKTGFNGAFTTTANSIKLRAQNKEVISINIAGGSGGGTAGEKSPDGNKVTGTGFYGIAPTLGDSWNNIDGQFQGEAGTTKTLSIEGPNAYDGQTTIARPTMSLSATGKNTWQCGDISNPFLRGYLDDGMGVTVMVHGIPYSKYDVIVYATSDSSVRLAPVTINGTQYTFADGETKPGSTVWGQGKYATPEIGKNALRINNCEGGTLTINAVRASNPDGRATLCGVQVINKGTVVISSKYVADVTAAEVTWTTGDDTGLTKYGQTWANSQLSTLTLTNKVASTLAFNPAEVLTGLTFKVVSAANTKMTIPYSSLEKLSFDQLDFSEAAGKVEINMNDVTEGSEGQTILAGDLTGSANVTYTSTGAWGAYADATGIHMAKTVQLSRNNPVTGTATTFERSFFGSTDASWNTLANWRMPQNGLMMPATALPGISGGDYPKILIDGNDSAQDTVSVNTLEGYNIQYAFLNGAQVTANTLTKIQTSAQQPIDMWIWVDGTSSFKVNALGDNQNWGTLNLYVAAENGITFPAFGKAATLNYYFTNNATAKFTGAVTAGTHTIKQMDLAVGMTAKECRHVEKKTLATFTTAGTTVTFVKDANIVIKKDNPDVTLNYIETVPTVQNDVGTYTIATESTGVYAYVVQYADHWDVVDPLTAVMPNETTDWSALTWTDAFGHTPYEIVGTHDYIVNASNVTATLNFAANVTTAKSITLKNDTADVLTLTKGAEVTAPTLTYSGIAGKAIVTWPVTALASSTDNVAYTGGAGTAENRVAIAHNGGTLNLEGGEYHLAKADSGTQTTVNMTDITADYVIPSASEYYAFTLGKAIYNLAGNTKISTPAFWLGQGAGNTSVFNMGGNATLTVTGDTNIDSNHSSIMFGHWDAQTTFTMTGDAFFAATNAQVLVGKTANTQTINLNGGTFVAKGIKVSSGASGTNTLNLNGGTMELGDVGIDSYSNNRTIAVNVTGDSTITSMAAMPITQTITVNAGKTLSLDATKGQITISKAMANSGTITVTGGTVLFKPGTFNGTITENGGTAKFGYYIDINEAGVFTVPEGKMASQIVLYKADGTAITPTKIEGSKIYYESSMEDFPGWWRYEFNGNLNNTGTSGHGAMTKWGADPTYTTDDKSLYIHARPALDMAATDWPETATYVMYGKMVRDDSRYQVVFGSKNGNTKNLVFLATGDVSENEVRLCSSINAAKPVVLCSMTVPNAQTADHLYAFVMKTVGGNTQVDIYLDGSLLQPYTFTGEFALGGGFQIGSPHGGELADYSQVADDDPGTLDFLRVYDKELNSDAMAKYAEEYPYHSPNGTYTRELTDAEGTWVQEGQWKSNDTAVVVSEPATNSVVQITADVATGLAVNLTEDKTYETVTFGGDGAIAVTNDMVNSGKVKVTGRITVNTSTRLAIDAFETYGSAISIGNGKVLTLDLGNADISKYWSSTSIDLTGAIICNDYDTQVKIEQPKTVKAPRTVTIRIDDASKHAWADIYVPTNDIIGTVSGGNISWSWADTAIEEADIDFDQTEVAIKIVMGENENLTLNEKYAKADLITVNGGNLDIGTNRNMTVTGAGTIDAKLSDEEKASTTEVTLFDVSGAASLAYRNVTDKDGTKLDVIGSNGKIKVRPVTDLKGLMFYMACPKPNYHDRDPNGRQSGWIDLVNYGPEAVDLANYKLVRCNMGKECKVTEVQEAVSNLLTKTIAKGETFRVYTSEDYETAEDYGGTGREVAWFKTEGGAVVKSASAAGSIMVVPTKVNPKKFPMVRLYKGTGPEVTDFAVVDEVVIPCDIDDDAVVEFGADATKRERWVVQKGVRTEYGPDVGGLYGVKKATTELALNTRGFVATGADFEVKMPINPFGTNGVALANNEITGVTLYWRVFDKDHPEAEGTAITMAKAGTSAADGQYWTNSIPVPADAAGKLIQYRAVIADAGGKSWNSPRFLNPDLGHKWYGAVVQPETTSDPLETNKVCTAKLQTFLMFVDNVSRIEMDKDVLKQDKTKVPYYARINVYDTQTKTYYDNVRIDLRGQTSASFEKKSYGLRFNKIAPLACKNPFDGEKLEVRKTSFLAEYGDPTYMRQALAFKLFREAGNLVPYDYPVRLYLNGTYFQLAFNSMRFTDELIDDYYGLNAEAGCAYKNVGQFKADNPGPTEQGTGTEKKTPDDDNEADMSVLDSYTALIDVDHRTLTAEQVTQAVMQKFNIPAWINYLASARITSETDDVWANMGGYINKYDAWYNPNGDDTMMPIDYDNNLTFGQIYNGSGTDEDWGACGLVATNDLRKSHPLYGGKAVPCMKKDKTTSMNRPNYGINALFQNETYRTVYLRRLRTLMDKFLGAPGTAKENTPIWQWMMTYRDAIQDDVPADRKVWYEGRQMGGNDAHCQQIWVWQRNIAMPDFHASVTNLWDDYIVPRREHLYVTHSITNTAKEIGYGTAYNAGIPESQAATTNLAENGKIYVTDSQNRRNTDSGFSVADGIIFIRNANTVAVDMSGWQLTGLAKVTFAAGTVLPAKKDSTDGKLIVVYDRIAARSTIASWGTTEPVIVNLNKEEEYFTPDNTTVCLRDEKGTEVQGTTFYITRAEGEDPSASTSQPAGTASIAVPMSWMEEHKIDTSVPASVLAEEMNTPMEGGNGATPWESYALGLSPEKKDSKPVISPVQTDNPEKVTFRLSNVTPVTGATVTYKVKAGTTPGGSDIGTSEAVDYDATQSMALPGSGVRYYTIEVKTVTESVTK